ncbi:MAG: hypothetical protein ACYTGQ_07910 [Planctomycetota bacterium]|jgi:hypothetical protein
MLKMAMILDNPGEQPHQTRYRDPSELRELGYSDLIIYPTTGLSGLLGPDTVSHSDERRWVTDQYDSVQRTTTEAKNAGLGVWLTYDAPSLARELVGSAMTCTNQPQQMLCPASDELLDMSGQCLEALVSQISGVDGVVLRLGDNDAGKLGYLVGNDIYTPHCSRCNVLRPADRLVRFIRFFYELVVNQLGKRLIVRAWNLRPGGMHDNPDMCQEVVEQLPVDDKLILSFKFTQSDFWRYQQWNAGSLRCGDRPVLYELQCQREFEAKGAIPNYQAPLWSRGMEEVDALEEPLGLAQVADRVNLAGLWAWVRGGGWRGPYIAKDTETWIDANVYAVPRLADDPKADPMELGRRWVSERLGCENDELAAAILEVLEHSSETALQAFYIGPYARARRDAWYPSANFIQDDQIDAEAGWAIMERLPDRMLDDVVREKQLALQTLSDDRRALQEALSKISDPRFDSLPLSLQYGETLVGTLRSLIAGMVAYRRWQRSSDPNHAQAAEEAMRKCQSEWVHHTQRIASHGGASVFDSDNLWDFTQQIIDKLHA